MINSVINFFIKKLICKIFFLKKKRLWTHKKLVGFMGGSGKASDPQIGWGVG